MNSEQLYTKLTQQNFLIAGPCVLETEELTLQSADRIAQIAAQTGVYTVFKSSWDKANRTSNTSYRGPTLEEGLRWLEKVKTNTNLPVLTDIHLPNQAPIISTVADIIQIPAFLSRQTDLIQKAGETGRVVNIKKGQFLAPWDMEAVRDKFFATGNTKLIFTERGTTFGYNNLVVDFRSISIMKNFGVPVVLDATHSVQLPGGKGTSSDGERQYVASIAKAGAAVNANGIFLECHPMPDQALCDGPNSLPLDELSHLVMQLSAIWDINNAK